MQGPFNVPHGTWSEVLPYIFVWLIGVSTRWIPLWQNRKKPDAEVRRTDAETRKLDAEASHVFSEAALAFSNKVSEAQRELDQQRERHEKRVEFLEKQIEIKTTSEQIARDRSHEAIGEVQRCVSRIRDYEELMTVAGISFERFVIKPYEKIMGTEDGK